MEQVSDFLIGSYFLLTALLATLVIVHSVLALSGGPVSWWIDTSECALMALTLVWMVVSTALVVMIAMGHF